MAGFDSFQGINFGGHRGVGAADPINDMDVVNYRTLMDNSLMMSGITLSAITITNLGAGQPVYAGETGFTYYFKSFSSLTPNLIVSADSNVITYSLNTDLVINGLTANTITAGTIDASIYLSGGNPLNFTERIWTASTGNEAVVRNNSTGNIALGEFSIIAGAYSYSSGRFSSIGGGSGNTANGNFSHTSGGYGNSSSGRTSFVGGGSYNIAKYQGSVVVGGFANRAYSDFNFIGGGFGNYNSSVMGVINGGSFNSAMTTYNVIGGGSTNFVSGKFAGQFGGYKNNIQSDYSLGGNGVLNIINSNANFSSIVNGSGNTINSAPYSHIDNGISNKIETFSKHNFIAIGNNNNISGQGIIIALSGNSILGSGSTIIGGFNNLIPSNIINSVLVGMNNYTPLFSNRVYTPALHVQDLTANTAGDNFVFADRNNGRLIISSVTDVTSLFTFSGLTGVTNIGGTHGIYEDIVNNVVRLKSLSALNSNILITSSSTENVIGLNNNIVINGLTANTITAVTIDAAIILSGGNPLNFSERIWTASTGPNAIVRNNNTNNIASGIHSWVAGSGNTASTIFSQILGGQSNVNQGERATILNGQSNLIVSSSYFINILGGFKNTATTAYSVIVNGKNNLANGSSTLIGTGNAHRVSAVYSTVLNGNSNTASTSYSLILQGLRNRVTTYAHGTIVNGIDNHVRGQRSLIGNGSGNTISGNTDFIGNGVSNTLYTHVSTILNGEYNFISGNLHQSILGGKINRITTNYAYNTIINGSGNTILSGQRAFIGNGTNNIISGQTAYSTILNGLGNIISNNFNTISGGLHNTIRGIRTAIINGRHNYIGPGTYDASIFGGRNNILNGSYSSISGFRNSALGVSAGMLAGRDNTITSSYSSTIGGSGNTVATFAYASIVGGQNNLVAGGASAVVGGSFHIINVGHQAAITGGIRNTINASYSFIGGGSNNVINGLRSAIIGGSANTVTAHYSVILGGQSYTVITNNVAMVPRLRIGNLPFAVSGRALIADGNGYVSYTTGGTGGGSMVGLLNVGGGTGNIYNSIQSGGIAQLRTLSAGTNMQIVTSGDEITFNFIGTGGGSGSIVTAVNTGATFGIFAGLSGSSVIALKSLSAVTPNIIITSSQTENAIALNNNISVNSIYSNIITATTFYSGSTLLENMFVTSGTNVGLGTIQLFKQKAGSILQFYSLSANNLSNTITLSNDILTLHDNDVRIYMDNDFTTTSNSHSDITGLNFAIAANEAWAIEIRGEMSCSSLAGMIQTVTAPSGALLRLQHRANSNSPANFRGSIINASGTDTSAFSLVANTTMQWEINGTISASTTPGTIQVRLRSVNNSDTSTILKGSYLYAKRLR